MSNSAKVLAALVILAGLWAGLTAVENRGRAGGECGTAASGGG